VAKGAEYRWVILATAIAAMASYSILYFGLSSLGPAISADLDLNEGRLGLVLSAPLAGMAVAVLGWGELVDRVGERPTLAIGLGGAGLSVLAASASEDAVELAALLFLSGLFGGASLYGLRAIAAWFPPPRRGLAVSSGQASIMLGSALGAAVLPTLADDLPLDEAFVLIGVICLAAAVASGVFLRSTPEELARRAAPRASGGPGRMTVVRDRRILGVSLAGALVQLPSVALLSFAPLLLVQESGESAAAAGAVVSVALVMAAAIRPVAGWVSDRPPGRLPTMLVLAVLTAVALLALAVASESGTALTAALVVVAMMLGLAGNGVSAAAVSDFAPPELIGHALSIRLISYMIANTIGPVLLGVLISTFDGYTVPLALLALPALASGALLGSMALRERSRAGAAGAAPTP
jgi:sugar phosphate permease